MLDPLTSCDTDVASGDSASPAAAAPAEAPTASAAHPPPYTHLGYGPGGSEESARRERVAAAAAITVTLKADSAAKRARAQQSDVDANLAQQLACDDAADEAALADEQLQADGETAVALEASEPSVPADYGTPRPPSMASAVKRGSEVNGVKCVYNSTFAMRAGGFTGFADRTPKKKAIKKKTWNKIGFRYVDSPHGHPVICGLDDEAVMIGVEVGMLILSINDVAVATAADAKRIFDHRQVDEGVVVYVSTSTVRELYETDVHELVAQAGGKPHWS